jgi:hypothetical protein
MSAIDKKGNLFCKMAVILPSLYFTVVISVWAYFWFHQIAGEGPTPDVLLSLPAGFIVLSLLNRDKQP